MATIRPSISVQCTYLEASLPVWLKLSTETYYGASSVRISVLFGKWHCFQTVASWWVSWGPVIYVYAIVSTAQCMLGRIYVISRCLFQVFGIWFVQLYDFSVYTNVVHLLYPPPVEVESYPLHLFFRNKQAGELLIFAFLEILPPPAMHACLQPCMRARFPSSSMNMQHPIILLTCFVAAHISNLWRCRGIWPRHPGCYGTSRSAQYGYARWRRGSTEPGRASHPG